MVLYFFWMRLLVNRPLRQHVTRPVLGFIGFWILFVYVLYMFFILLLSVAMQGIEWPIKLGRVFLFAVVGIQAYLYVVSSGPDFEVLVVKWLKWITLVSAVLYVLYNLFGWEIYADDAYEIFSPEAGGDGVRRNFAAFPYFGVYFYVYFLIHAFRSRSVVRQAALILCAGLLLLCIGLTLTRGLLITALAAVPMTLFLSGRIRFAAKALITIVIFAIMGTLLFGDLVTGYLDVLLSRFDEIFRFGISNVDNASVRSHEFLEILYRVLNSNPLVGFGFVNAQEARIGGRFLYAGSPDNAYSNLLGVSGFIGLSMYLLLLLIWTLVCMRLIVRWGDVRARVSLVFIFCIFAANFIGSTFGYIQSFVLFMVFDFYRYYQLRHNNVRAKARNTIFIRNTRA
ncbi:hypothetical protein LMG23994_01434 [Cupriavidus pinatubonensis]|uniref:O-antigen polymerase n=2 Tax=Cupriavidus pinatubonensis TaxID=248026 RepID=A0ABM8WN43_9BURK|nr:hypothetical protein LMG23994_01434 [Cupriavidus pinatubonensis]